MIWHWLTTGWRSLVANPLFSLITIASLSIGCAGALLAGANIKQHLSFERWVPDSERIFMVVRKSKPPSLPAGAAMRMDGPGANRPQAMSPGPMHEALADRIPDMETQVRAFRGQSLLPPDPSLPQGPPAPGEPPRTPPPGSIYVDPEFFNMFPMQFVAGSAEGLTEPDRIVITETAAKRLFGEAPALGQTVEGSQKRQLTIIGVVRDLPSATHLRFEAIGGMRTFELMRTAAQAGQNNPFGSLGLASWNNGPAGAHYIKMAPGTDAAAFAASTTQIMQAAADIGSKQTPTDSTITSGSQTIRFITPNFIYSLVPLLDVHLGGPDLTGIQSTGDITMLLTLAGAAFALLGVSSFNYVTLSLARSLRRRREVAVRKVLGADQGALVRHYLAESGLVTAISLAIGFTLAWLLHPWFARTIGQPETLFDLFDPVFLGGSLAVFAILALAVGAYPAFYLASVRPRTALGEGGAASHGRTGQLVTAGLMGLQISAATGLLIVALSMTAQARYIETRPLGFTVKDRYQINANCAIQPQMNQQVLMAMMQRCQSGTRQILARVPGLINVAYFNGQVVSENIQMLSFGRTGQSDKLGEMARMSVDADFLQTMGATLLAGRFFDKASAYDRALIDMQTAAQAAGPPVPGQPPPPRPQLPKRVPVIVTRAMLPMLGAETPEAAIGQQISSQPNAPFPFEIIGVVEDWHQRPLKYAVHPLVFVPSAGNQAVVEIPEGEAADVQERLTKAWKEIMGTDNASVSVNPLETVLERTYQADFQLMRAVTSFAVVAILVACLGVFGLSAFEMQRRVREIGIRKALGASPLNVAAMVIGRAMVFAAIATVVAWPIAFWMAQEWLSGFVYRTNLGFAVLPLASLIIIVFVALAVTLNSIRAAAIRPGFALRAT